MADFDPYLKWLGIRDPVRPINHYRLLGLEFFESDPDVISIAADRQMSHIRTYQNGPHGEISQRILNELAAARRCLLVADRKQPYDEQLQQQLSLQGSVNDHTIMPTQSTGQKTAKLPTAKAPTASTSPPTIQHGRAKKISASDPPAIKPAVAMNTDNEDLFSGIVQSDESGDSQKNGLKASPDGLRKNRKHREKKELVMGLIAWISGGLAALGVAAWLIGSGILPGFNKNDPVQNGSIPAVAEKKSGDANKSANRKNDDRSNSTVIAENSNSQDNNSQNSSSQNSNSQNNRTTDSGNSLSHDLATNKPNPENSNTATKNTISNNDADPLPDQTVGKRDSRLGWELPKFSQYPKPDMSARQLIALVTFATSRDKVKRLEVSQKQGGTNEYESVAGDGGLLAGLVLSKSDDGSISSIRPVFLNLKGLFTGTPTGIEQTPFSVIARPGYAVGSVSVSKDLPMDGLRLTFMKIKKEGLDTTDAYISPWVGRNARSVSLIANTEGLPVIGTYGRFEKGGPVSTLGLIVAEMGSGAMLKPSTDSSVASTSPTENKTAETGTSETMMPTNVDPKTGLSTNTLGGNSDLAPGSTNSTANLASTRAAVPVAKEIRTAEKDLKKIYRNQIADAKTPLAIRNLAREILLDTSSTNDSSTMNYVMLREVVELAVSVGDATTAIESVRRMNESFDVDFWELATKTVESSAGNVSKRNANEFRGTLNRLIDEATDLHKFKTAAWLAEFAIKKAQQAQDTAALEEYQAIYKNITEVADYTKLEGESLEALEKDPDDPVANLRHGDFLLVVNDDWENAIKFWSKSSHARKKKIAEQEVEVDRSDPDEILKLAGAWESVVGSGKTAHDRRCLERALDLATSTLNMLDGLQRRKVENEIESLRKALEN